ncbi:hypothetical protein [Psychromonas ossibalaenae]|uniref:hypothetical protein n=1 Tax=Psychromonas ossibalaenae TaxID=444922 RepID=UPI0003668F97|nr:hypothetical protein [Psychromonas ossibalaenae]
MKRRSYKNSPVKVFVKPSPDTRNQWLAEKQEIFPQASQLQQVIVGFGPCSIIAALLLALMGLEPVVIERGQDARQRTKDTWGEA